VGTKVTIVNQPYLFAWDNGQLLFEAHMPLMDDPRSPADQLRRALNDAMVASGLEQHADESRLALVADAAMGVPLPLLTDSPPPETVMQSVPLVNNLVAHLTRDEAN